MRNAGIEGPIFISVGEPEKLITFLDKNPSVPRDSAFVDSSENFNAFQTANIGNIGDLVPKGPPLIKPELTGKMWWDYITNAVKLAPANIEGVKRLGGSFVVSGDEVVYQHFDAIPGDDAPIEDVLLAAGA